MTITSIKRIILSLPKQVVSVFDLGYLGVGKDFPEQISSLPNRKKRNQTKRKKSGDVSRTKKVQLESL